MIVTILGNTISEAITTFSVTVSIDAIRTMREAMGVTPEGQRQKLRGWKGGLLPEALERFVAQHLGERWQGRRGPTPWVCPTCGSQEAQQVKRNGHYKRGLVVLEGPLSLRGPQLRCEACGKGVALTAPFLPPWRRF